MSPVDESTLDRDLKIIRDRRGAQAVRRGSDAPEVERIPVDSPALMRITEGGIPLGRISRLWGPPSSGKTMVAYLLLAAAQRYRVDRFPNGLRCAYWNVEGIWDPVYAASLGVDTKNLLLEEVKIIEDIARELELLLRSCHCHIVDSCSSAKATDELASEADDWHRALDARAWKRALNRIEAAFDGEDNVLVLLDHASEDQTTKVQYARGGRALEHASSMSIQFRPGGWLFYHPQHGYLEKADKIKEEVGVSPSGLKEPDGAEMSVRVSKSRVCRPFRAAKLRLDFHRMCFDTTFELLDAATFFDAQGVPAHRSGEPALAQRTGPKSSYYVFPDKTRAQGQRGLRDRIEKDESFRAAILKAMLSGW